MADFLSGLPSRTQRSRADGSGNAERLPVGGPAAAQHAAAAASGSAAGDSSAGSRLHAIVTQHLRHQHRKACLRSAAPTMTLPPISLLKRHELPQVRQTVTLAPCTAPSPGFVAIAIMR